jgi:phospholipid transport system substrate-binding protein
MTLRLFIRMRLLGFVAFVAASILAFTAVEVSADDKAPTAAVEKFHDTLIENMKNGKALGFDGRAAKLQPVVDEVFDIPAMARISSGGGWAKMTPAVQADVIAAFSAFTIASYAGNFASWDGESFVTKEQGAADKRGNVLIDTRLNAKGIPPVQFNYRLHQVDGVWKVFDIYLEGAISQLAMRRAEFAAVLARGTPADLVTHMKKLAVDARKGEG